jgi:hypothetical protein
MLSNADSHGFCLIVKDKKSAKLNITHTHQRHLRAILLYELALKETCSSYAFGRANKTRISPVRIKHPSWSGLLFYKNRLFF